VNLVSCAYFLHEHQLRFDILGGGDIDFSFKIFTIISLSFAHLGLVHSLG